VTTTTVRQFSFDEVRHVLGGVLGPELHAKRVDSLSTGCTQADSRMPARRNRRSWAAVSMVLCWMSTSKRPSKTRGAILDGPGVGTSAAAPRWPNTLRG